MVRKYQNLEVFNLAYAFTLKLYPIIDTFPEIEGKNLVLQMKRAAVSIPMNIAEGSSRKTDREFLPFLSYAFGSAKELEVTLKFSKDFNYINEETYLNLNKELDTFTCKLKALMNYLEKQVSNKKEVAMAQISRRESNPAQCLTNSGS